MKHFLDNFHFDNYTLDLDSSVLPCYGSQTEGAKKGRNSHHPLIAFVSDVNLVANMWLRSGNASAANNFLSFLEDTLQKLQNKTIGLIRLDSGFFHSDIMDYLEERSIDYIIAAKFTHPIQRIITRNAACTQLDESIATCQQYYQPEVGINQEGLFS